MPTLVATSGPLAGQSFEIIDELTLGREADGVCLPDDECSRRHATVRIEGRGLIIEDLGSLNGTWVEERRIDGPTTLVGGEHIRIGETTFELEADPEPEPEIDSGATRLRAQPAAPDATVMRPAPAEPPAPDPDRTTIRPRPGPVSAPPPSPPPPPAAPPAPAPVATAPAPARAAPVSAPAPAVAASPPEPFGALAPTGTTADRRSRAAATRLLYPTIAAYAVILLTAVALVVYFASR